MDNHNQHSGQFQSAGMKKYKAVASLKNINAIADRIDINFDNLDSITSGELRQTIAEILHKFTEFDLSEEKSKYVKTLIKQNMGNRIDIDYAKLDKDDEDLLMSYTLKTEIQNTLSKRKGIIYRDLMLNANY